MAPALGPIAVLGLGATGSHVARQLRGHAPIQAYDSDADRQQMVVDALEDGAVVGAIDGRGCEVVVLATPSGGHARAARRALNNGAHVVSLSDRPRDVAQLLALDGAASAAGRTVVAGAGFAPGLTCLLARHAAALLDSVDSVAVSKAGTGGPACARQHHRALKRAGRDWVDGTWLLRRGGSGRDLAWFPDPIGARDCYRAALPSPLLLQRIFPDASRLSARVAATRRDRSTSRLPMLRPPHADGGQGAVRVEVRGLSKGAVETVVYGVMDRPSVAAGAVAAVAALVLRAGGGFAPGAYGLGECADPLALLLALHERGIRAATYQGSGPVAPR
ncbi:MAG: hypothetical protein ACI8TP_003292 [Acidimicrobiales bacterium]|jgi:hypothetical protein